MSDILLEPFASDILQALEANLQAHAQLYAGLPGAIKCDEPGVVGLMTDLDVSESCIYRATFIPEQAEEKIEQVLQRFRSHGCLPMWWIVGPSTQPVDLGKQLERRGFQRFARPPGMAADLHNLAEQPALPADFMIECVSDTIRLGQWTEIVGVADEISEALKIGFYGVFASQGFGPDAPCRLFLGMENGRPVAASRLFCAGGVAGIYHVATLPERGGRGYGTVMTLAAAQAGRDLGYRIGGLFATPAGYRIYRRLGFQEYCHLDVYLIPPS